MQLEPCLSSGLLHFVTGRVGCVDRYETQIRKNDLMPSVYQGGDLTPSFWQSLCPKKGTLHSDNHSSHS